MQVEIKATSDGIGYVSKSPYEWQDKKFEADIQEGDTVEILNEGSIEEGKFGAQHYFKIMTRNGEKKAPFNQSSINVIAGKHGTETKEWVGVKVNVLTKKGVFAGTKGIAVYYVIDGWYLDDFGDLVTDVVEEKTDDEKKALQDAIDVRKTQGTGSPELTADDMPKF